MTTRSLADGVPCLFSRTTCFNGRQGSTRPRRYEGRQVVPSHSQTRRTRTSNLPTRSRQMVFHTEQHILRVRARHLLLMAWQNYCHHKNESLPVCFASCDYNVAAMHLWHLAYYYESFFILFLHSHSQGNLRSLPNLTQTCSFSCDRSSKSLTSVHPDSVEGYFLATFTPPLLPLTPLADCPPPGYRQ